MCRCGPIKLSTPKTKTETAEVMVEADMGSLFWLRCMRRNGIGEDKAIGKFDESLQGFA
jgi:hypothetical protein